MSEQQKLNNDPWRDFNDEIDGIRSGIVDDLLEKTWQELKVILEDKK